MRILLSCLQSPRDYPISAYRYWERYFKQGLTEAGHTWAEVPGIDWVAPLATADPTKRAAWRTDTWSRVLEFIRLSGRQGGVDLFLSYCYPEMIDETAIREIRRQGIPCVNYFCDNVREHTVAPSAFGCYDLHWVPEVLALSQYQAAGYKGLHLPMPCWVPPEHRTVSTREDQRVVFVGSPDAMRRELLGEVISRSTGVFVAGGGWNSTPSQADNPLEGGTCNGMQRLSNQVEFVRRHGSVGFVRKLARKIAPARAKAIPSEYLLGKLSGSDYADVTRDSMIVLGINRVVTFRRSWAKPLVYSRLRDIEGPMMGACYLTEWTDDLAAFYEIGVEVETYRDAAELTDQIVRLRADPIRRQRLRQGGQAKALTEHSVGKSISRIAAALGLGDSRPKRSEARGRWT